MAKEIVQNPTAALQGRPSDVGLSIPQLSKISLFSKMDRPPSFEKFPGSYILRRYKKGEKICLQGEAGWTAFYILKNEDIAAIGQEQIAVSMAEFNLDEESLLQSGAYLTGDGEGGGGLSMLEINLAEQRHGQLLAAKKSKDADAEEKLREVAMVYLATRRTSVSRKPNASLNLFKRPNAPSAPGQPRRNDVGQTVYIPVGGDVTGSYDMMKVPLKEGELFGEASCLFRVPRSATIVATRDCYVLEMLRNILDQIRKNDKSIKQLIDDRYKKRVLQLHLRKLSLFRELSDQEFKLVEEKVHLESFEPGSMILDENERPWAMFIVRSGLVKVVRNCTSLLAMDSVSNWDFFVRALREGADEKTKGTPKRRVWELLDEKTQRIVTTYDDPNKMPDEIRQEVLFGVNELLKLDAKFCDAAEMKPLALLDGVREKTLDLPDKRPKWTTRHYRRYNRVLLHEVLTYTPPEKPAVGAKEAGSEAAPAAPAEKPAPKVPPKAAAKPPAPAAPAEGAAPAAPAKPVPKAAVAADGAAPAKPAPGPKAPVAPKAPPAAKAPAKPAATPTLHAYSGRTEYILSYVSPGEFIGEGGVITGAPVGATCFAHSHPNEQGTIELVRISRADFQDLTRQIPALAQKAKEEYEVRRKEAKNVLDKPLWDETGQVERSQKFEQLGLIQGQQLMLIDLDRCTRCDECVKACVTSHDDGKSRLFLDGNRFGKYLVPVTCRSCLDPVCMIGCPVASIHRGENREIVIENWCIGCAMCAENCPYGSIQMHDVGVIGNGVYGWRFMPAVSVTSPKWFDLAFKDDDWLLGCAPFFHERDFLDTLKATLNRRKVRAMGPSAILFRYEFHLGAVLGKSFKLSVSSTAAELNVWINGDELTPDDVKRGGERLYNLPKPVGEPAPKGKQVVEIDLDENFEWQPMDSGEKKTTPDFSKGKWVPTFRVGKNVLAIRVLSNAVKSTDVVLDVRMDEIRKPEIPKHAEEESSLIDEAEREEIIEKIVSQKAVVCDLCSSLPSQTPACVNACPHEAAMRVDSRSSFPRG